MITHNSTFENFDKKVRIDATERQCGDCTYCCEGWLTCNVFGYEVGNGVGCKFVKPGKGCGAYEFRPEDPCKSFKCYYRQNSLLPERFKPSVVGNIVIYRQLHGIPFLDIVEAGNVLNLDLLDWVLTHYREGKVDSVRYFYRGQANWITRDSEFDKAMQAEQKRVIEIFKAKT